MTTTTISSFNKWTTTTATLQRLRAIVDSADLTSVEKVKAVKNEVQEYKFRTWMFKWYTTNSVFGKCYSADTKSTLGKVTIIKPVTSWIPNSRGEKLNPSCIYLVVPVEGMVKPLWINVPYRKYNNKAKAFDASMKALIKKAKTQLGIK